MAKTEALEQSQSSLPVGGVLVKALISAFTQKPHKGDDSWSTCSVGVAQDSIVATDTHSAIIIGRTQAVHEATQRKEVLIDCERSKLYGEAIPIDNFARLVDKASGKVEIMPDIGRLVSKEMATMKSIGAVDPSALQRIGTIAAAAGAYSVELFQQESGDAKTLGFTFQFRPRDEHQNLFQTWEGEIDARGVIVVREGSGAKWDTLEDEEAVELESPEPKAKAKTKKAKEEASGEEFSDPEPDSPSVSFLRLESSVDPSETRDKAGFKLPALATLAPDDLDLGTGGEHRDAIIATLRDFNIVARVVAIHVGPTVTQYEIEIQKGVPGKRVAALADDLQRALAVKSIRIEAPIPGKSAIGIELPNAKPQKVSLRSLAGLNAFLESDKQLLVGLGLNVSGDPVYADLEAMPHLLIGGATNSGKSIGVASILASLLMRNTPDELRLVLIDPKKVELALFDEIPHLMLPVVTDMAEVPAVLEALVNEMEVRYDLLKKEKVRNITGYNDKAITAPSPGDDPHEGFDPLPRIVVVIDELADLMMQFGDECEDLIVRLAQKARAVGIHLVIATQRPSVDVVTGLIKANVPSRIAFAVAQMVDSRVVIDQPGAERLLGRGDMLFAPVEGGGKTIRVQGCYISEGEVEAICSHWKEQARAGGAGK